jgi:ATP-dependent protease ClpP protease subunit
MKHLSLGLVLLIGCATVPIPKADDPAKADTTDPLAALLGLLGEIPKVLTPACLVNGCTFNIHDEIDENMGKDFSQWIDTAKDNHVTLVNISINSPGGIVDDGYVIIHAMEASDKAGIKSNCTVDGTGASMAFAILQSCTYRYMTSRSELMAHQEKLNIKEHVGENDLANALAMIHADNIAIAHQCSHRMNITFAEYLDKVNNHDWWITADEALRVGAVDQIVKF